ncbi:hypothetical protein [Acinetobacter sp. YH1901134]|uniref:hypothetical protein n=1 Tax=Acinetobacter sp. YH1901134 TaxID=2601199 RepID=UPI0015D45B1C|nr:hypothetical protein [Acinetobacter sp. YH1901134]
MESVLVSICTAIIFFLMAKVLAKYKKKPKAKIIHFKNNQSAFEHACLTNKASFFQGIMSFGIVRDVIDDNSGKQFLIELADSDGTKIVSGFNDKKSEKIHLGNIVYWGFKSTAETNILDIQAVGYVLATLNPEFNPNTNKWSIREDLTK